MKKYLKLYSVVLALVMCLFTSCLKEDNLFTDDGNGGANGILELSELAPRASSTAYAAVVSKSFDAVAEVDVPISVNFTGVNGAPQDVTVEMAINNSAVTNTAHTVLPTSLYTIPSSTLTIKKGQKTANFIIKVKAASFNFALTYALGIQIKSASVGKVSGNYGTGVFVFTSKNQWDGVYSIEAGSKVTRYSAPGVVENPSTLNGPIAGNAALTLSTVGASTVQIAGMTWSGAASGIAGIDNTRITIDPATNLVTMSALGNLTLVNMPGTVNKYDPATKTFTLSFWWNQTTAPRELVYNLKFLRAR